MSQGRIGGRRSIVFTGRDTNSAAEPKPQPDPFVVWQSLKSDARLIDDKLKRLGVDSTGVHGDLQVILSAARRIEAAVKELIKDTES